MEVEELVEMVLCSELYNIFISFLDDEDLSCFANWGESLRGPNCCNCSLS